MAKPEDTFEKCQIAPKGYTLQCFDRPVCDGNGVAVIFKLILSLTGPFHWTI